MSRLRLSFACCRYDRTEAIREGSVAVEGAELISITLKSGRDVFDRMVGGREFDVSELSASEYITLVGRGDCPFVALPVFPSRVFRHGYIFINRRPGVRTPKDLEGRRVGLPLYTQTAAIWARGHLMHQVGVDLDSIRWVQGAVETAGAHGKPHAPSLLRHVAIEQNTSGTSLADLLAKGEIDALIGSRRPGTLGRDGDVVRLFPDYRALEREFYRTTGIFPIMHLIVIRRELHERHGWLATSLYPMFDISDRVARAN
jgi:4,5-dihydroxyphthalate decarboxylase